MLLSWVGYGNYLETVDTVKIYLSDTECNYHSCKAFKHWYMDETHNSAMMSHYGNKLKNLYLDHDTSATKHILFLNCMFGS